MPLPIPAFTSNRLEQMQGAHLVSLCLIWSPPSSRLPGGGSVLSLHAWQAGSSLRPPCPAGGFRSSPFLGLPRKAGEDAVLTFPASPTSRAMVRSAWSTLRDPLMACKGRGPALGRTGQWWHLDPQTGAAVLLVKHPLSAVVLGEPARSVPRSGGGKAAWTWSWHCSWLHALQAWFQSLPQRL